jgi:hypothetical protein
VLLYGALCEALLDYSLPLILGADDISGQIIETAFRQPSAQGQEAQGAQGAAESVLPRRG